MSLRLGSNIEALMAMRRLNQSSQDVSLSLERLSSGMRINRASDDAAGLSIATSLRADSRVFNQGLRNINDGLSALNMAQSGAQQLSDILIRLRELATTSSNGVFSRTQRITLDNEADILVREYNRIAGSTVFNGLNLLNGNSRQIGIQLGYGTNGRIDIGMGSEIARTVGTGSFSLGQTYSDVFANDSTLVDLNGDGILDLASVGYSQSLVTRMGNGNGTFGAATTVNFFDNANSLVGGDFDGDGLVDVAVATNSGVYILHNNGGSTPTFTLTNTMAIGGQLTISARDVNADGKMDILAGSPDTGTNSMTLLLGNGNGTFRTPLSFTGMSVRDVKIADFNGDGKMDLLNLSCGSVFPGDGRINIFLGNGNGTFQGQRSYFFADSSGGKESFDIGDINHDGIMDVVAGNGFLNSYSVFLGNSDGSLNARTTYATGFVTQSASFADFNGDGYLDLALASATSNVLNILIGNGDGTFRSQSTYSYTNLSDISIADINGDGVLDIVGNQSGASSVIGVLAAQTTTTSNSQRFDLTTQAGALASLSLIDAAFNRVSAELGKIGSYQSRLQFAHGALMSMRDNYYAAYGRIIDVDVAEESANLVRRTIAQQAAAAVLAQANQQPALVLQLLKYK